MSSQASNNSSVRGRRGRHGRGGHGGGHGGQGSAAALPPQLQVSPDTILPPTQPSVSAIMHESIIGEIRAMRDELASRLDAFNARLGEVEKWQRGTGEDEEEDTSEQPQQEAGTSTPLLDTTGHAGYPPTTPAFVTRRSARILPHQVPRSTDPQSSPIQAHALRSQLFTTPSPSGSTPLDRFKAMTTPERRKIRLAMKKLGIQVQEFMGAADDSGSVTSQDGHDGDLAVDGEDTSNESPLQHVIQPDTPPGPVIAPAPNIRPGQPLTCKQEFLGKYSGDPTRLEAFLSRVRDVIWSDNSAAWTAAVMRALPIALTDEAAVWHEGLQDLTASSLTSFEAWSTTMRKAFPINTAQQRREARERRWTPATDCLGLLLPQGPAASSSIRLRST